MTADSTLDEMAAALAQYLSAGCKDSRRAASFSAKAALHSYEVTTGKTAPPVNKELPKSTGRVSVTKRVLQKLIERDGINCCWCGVVCQPFLLETADRYPTIEHVIRKADGGSENMTNLKVACRKCNNGRHHPNWCDVDFVVKKPGHSAPPPKPPKAKPLVSYLTKSSGSFRADVISDAVNFVYRDHRNGGVVIMEFMGNDILEADAKLKEYHGVDVFSCPSIGCRMEPVVHRVEHPKAPKREPCGKWIPKFLKDHHKSLRIAPPTKDEIAAKKLAFAEGKWTP